MSLYIQADSKLNAFVEYLNVTGFYDELPSYLHSWVDLDMALNDYISKGLKIENVTSDIYFFSY